MVRLVFWMQYREVMSRLRARKVHGRRPCRSLSMRSVCSTRSSGRWRLRTPSSRTLCAASDPRVHYKRRVVKAGLGFLIGVALLLAGVVSKYIWIGVAGFLVMLATAMWALNSWRRISGSVAAKRAPSTRPVRARRKAAAAVAVPVTASWSGWKSAGVGARKGTCKSPALTVTARRWLYGLRALARRRNR